VVIFEHEKSDLVMQEIYHHWGVASAIILSGGTGTCLKAALSLGVKTLTLARNEAHKNFLVERVLDFMVHESHSNPKCPYYISRSKLLENLGLSDDEDKQSSVEDEGEEHGLDGEVADEEHHQHPLHQARLGRWCRATQGNSPS